MTDSLRATEVPEGTPLYQLYATDLDEMAELLDRVPGGAAGRVDRFLARIAEIRAERDGTAQADATLQTEET